MSAPQFAGGSTSATPEEEERRRAEHAEVAELLRQGDLVTNETLESTRRMKQMATETRDVGAKTLETLHHQGGMLAARGGAARCSGGVRA